MRQKGYTFMDLNGSFTCPQGAIVQGSCIYRPIQEVYSVLWWGGGAGNYHFTCYQQESN